MDPIHIAFQTFYASIIDEVSKALDAEGHLTKKITTLLEKQKTTKNRVAMAEKRHDFRRNATLRFQPLIDHVIASARQDMNRWKESGWITCGNGYERPLCNTMGFDLKKGRYKDADFVDKDGWIHEIEIKKGQNLMWFNGIRYAEQWQAWDTYKDHMTMFVQWDKKLACVKTISFIELDQMMKMMVMDDETAYNMIRLRDKYNINEHTNKKINPCFQLNYQANQLKAIACATIDVATLTVKYNPRNPVNHDTDYETAKSKDDASDEESDEPKKSPVEKAKKGRRTAADIDRILAHNQRVKHSVCDRRSGTTFTQEVRYDKRMRTFVDDITGMRYNTLNNMGVAHLFKVFGTRRTLSVWECCKAYTPEDDTWVYLHKLYEQQTTK